MEYGHERTIDERFLGGGNDDSGHDLLRIAAYSRGAWRRWGDGVAGFFGSMVDLIVAVQGLNLRGDGAFAWLRVVAGESSRRVRDRRRCPIALAKAHPDGVDDSLRAVAFRSLRASADHSLSRGRLGAIAGSPGNRVFAPRLRLRWA